jgi:4a-hydroxytetrahydrobiopterin dehydratase
MVRDKFAPAWWTLADAAGNEADIATTMSRE